MTDLAETPKPPYYAVIFTSIRTDIEDDEYGEMADRMLELARQQPGYLGVEYARTPGDAGITVSYWEDEASIRAWRDHAEHQVAQKLGRSKWYKSFALRIARVEEARII
ncbi:MAG: antibiotic biosynthesis monooxygenase [Planctomycetaceae bacterium]